MQTPKVTPKLSLRIFRVLVSQKKQAFREFLTRVFTMDKATVLHLRLRITNRWQLLLTNKHGVTISFRNRKQCFFYRPKK